MAMVAIARRTGRSLLSPAARGGGGRLWHAPLPSRNRFAVYGADSGVPPRLDARGGGMWSPSAWAWASYYSQEAGAVLSVTREGINAGTSQEAMWRALLDIRTFVERMDARSDRQERTFTLFAEQQNEISRWTLKLSSGHGTWKVPVIFLAIFLVAWLLFTVGAENAVEIIDDFLLARVNKVVTDPEVLKNVQSAAVMVSANVSRSYNPLHRFKVWVVGGKDEAPELSNAEVVSKDTFLAMTIILLLQVNHTFGSTADNLMDNLRIIGLKDPQKNLQMLELLGTMGYVESHDTFSKRTGHAKSYWPSKAALDDSASGLLEKKMRKTLLALRKVEQAASANEKKT